MIYRKLPYVRAKKKLFAGILDTSQNLTQYAFRFRNDDGSESAATYAAAENINLTTLPGEKIRIRIGIDALSDPSSKQFKLEYRHKPSGGSFGAWRAVGNWNPSVITTALWLDAADVSTITLNGSDVSGWNDKSGNGRHFAQSSAALQPAYISNILNSLGGLRFDGANELASTVQMMKDACSYYVAFKLNTAPASASFQCALCFTYDTNNLTEFLLMNIGGYTEYQVNNDYESTTTGVGVDEALITTPQIFEWTYNDGAVNSASSYTFYQTGTSKTSTASSTVSITEAAISKIGNRIAQDFKAKIDLYEIIVMAGVADSATRQKIEGYLAWKWGLQANLPTGHTYINGAP